MSPFLFNVQRMPAKQVSVNEKNLDIISGSTAQLAIESIDDNLGTSQNSLSAITAASGNWDSTHTTVNTFSALWEESTDISYLSASIDVNTSNIANIAQVSGNWDSAYTQVNTLSDSWEESTDISYLSASIDINTTNIAIITSDVIYLSASIDTNSTNITNLESDVTYLSSSIDTNSTNITNNDSDIVYLSGAIYDNTTAISTSSNNWNSTYTTVGANSASWVVGANAGSVQNATTLAISATNPGSPIGDARGVNSVDLQTGRSFSTQVASGMASVVIGGIGNTASGPYSTVGGGVSSVADGCHSTIGGGWLNTASYCQSTIGGGNSNIATGQGSTIGGGTANCALGSQSVIAGGSFNSTHQLNSTIGGGGYNRTLSGNNTIAGGFNNCITMLAGTVGGGQFNIAAGNWSTIAGGTNLSACGEYSVVGGGGWNYSGGDYSTVAGGTINCAPGLATTIAGGLNNRASGYYSGILGGRNNDTKSLSGAMIIGNDISAVSEDTLHANNITVFGNISAQGNLSANDGHFSADTLFIGGVPIKSTGSTILISNLSAYSIEVNGSDVGSAIELAHTQNTDIGTTKTTFALASGSANGTILKQVGNILQLRTLDDVNYADIKVGSVTVEGSATIIHSEDVTIDDNILTLNSNVTAGLPTENAGITIKRGASANALFIWNEGNDTWAIGTSGIGGLDISSVAVQDDITYLQTQIIDNRIDITNVADTSANWNSVYTSVTDTSANWDSVYSNVADTSANWDSVYSNVNDTSGIWGTEIDSTTLGLGISTIDSVPSGSYKGVFYDLVVYNVSATRVTNFMMTWSDISPYIQFTQTATTDIGDTSPLILSGIMSQNNAILITDASTSGWTVKGTRRAI